MLEFFVGGPRTLKAVVAVANLSMDCGKGLLSSINMPVETKSGPATALAAYIR